jgi:glutamate racemase
MVTIGVIDSGAGGAYFEKRLKEINPKVNIIRYSPEVFESYSNISIQSLCTLSSYHIDYINNECADKQLHLNCIVIACMTLSTNCLEFVKSEVNVPVYDMLTCLPYITNDTTVFATPNSIKSNRFSYCIEVPCSNLSTDIENNKFKKHLKQDLQYYVDRLNLVCTKKILLGCSHYSIIKKEFEEVFNPLEIIDPVEILIKIMKQVYF